LYHISEMVTNDEQWQNDKKALSDIATGMTKSVSIRVHKSGYHPMSHYSWHFECLVSTVTIFTIAPAGEFQKTGSD
jgi:hypothetical protein